MNFCKKLPKLILMIFCLIFFSCQSTRIASESGELQVSTNKLSVILTKTSAAQFDERTGIWYSAFPLSGKGHEVDLLERRKKMFVALFEDERDPYTGNTNVRSNCLISVMPNEVRFKSGPPPSWSECRTPEAIERTRAWLVCANILWEITYEMARPSASFHCR